ncbi:MAG: ABC transporter ATP-binding protein [Nitriliruptor sp.]|uniref:ABC transporter ATP-binding protein n=1 Tax=Nitriliruptor sp. TaxID=2448056 RepID=UPI0034A0A237
MVRDGGRLIWHFVREQPLAFTLAAAGAIAFTGAIVASAVVVGHVTDDVIVPVLAEGEPVGGRLRTAVLLILAIAVWKAVGIIVRRTTAGWLQFGAQFRLRERVLAHQLRLSLRWYGSRTVGDLLSVSDSDAQRATFVLAPLPFATGVAFLLVGATGVVVVTDTTIGLMAGALLLIVIAIDLWGGYRTFAAMEEEQRRRGGVARVAHESFDGALTVKSLGREVHETERFRNVTEHLRDQTIEVGRVWTGYRAFTEALPAIGTVAILVVGVARIAAGELTTGELVRVAYLISLLAVPIRLIGYLMWDTANSVAGWTRIAEVLDVDDVVTFGALGAGDSTTAAVVEADAVEFAYGDDGPPVLAGLELRVEPGRTVAVVGPTGSGKSTLALLLARLWDPDRGVVTLDDRDLRELASGVVPSEVAYVAQDSFLFDDDVRGNITLGDAVDDDRVEAALRLAGATRFVAALPEGLATRLGERGTTLSGGQQQRLALARALVRSPRLLILDDATSAVDPTVEAEIIRGLQRAELPSTIVIVAYRRSSIVLADEVVHIDGGRVVSQGSHEELLASDPGYAALLQAYEVDAAARAAELEEAAPDTLAAGPDERSPGEGPR